MFPLDGVRLKIERAGEHRQTFERELINFFEREPERAVAKRKDDGPPELILTEPVPPKWSCIIGDVVQNLRQAFDHFVWACALRDNAKPNRIISFPITMDEPGWSTYVDTDHARVTRRAVGEQTWGVITKMQPHSRWRPDPNPGTDPLWAINKFARIDRHQTPHLTAVQNISAFFGFGPLPLRGNVVTVDLPEGSSRFATPAFLNDSNDGGWSVQGPGGESKVDTYVQLPFEIVFDPDGNYAPNSNVSQMLTAMYESVKGWFLPRMEAAYAGDPIL